MIKPLLKIANNQDGFVLVLSMLIMVVLIVIGVTSLNTSKTDMQIAGNAYKSQRTFYAADSGLELGGRLIEENALCPQGFTATTIGSITIRDQNFWSTIPSNLLDSTLVTIDFDNATVVGDNDGRDDRAFSAAITNNISTDVVIAGTTKFAPGSSIQMVSGYEGKGKGAAAGGAYIAYDIIAQANDSQNSRSELQIGWNHIIGSSGTCNY